MNQLLYITGHIYDNSKQVTQYGPDGFLRDLPELNTGRFDHACSGYYNQQDVFVLLVVGGRTEAGGERPSLFCYSLVLIFYLDILSSTEVFELGSTNWNTLSLSPLQNEISLWGLRAVSVDNMIYLTGEE